MGDATTSYRVLLVRYVLRLPHPRMHCCPLWSALPTANVYGIFVGGAHMWSKTTSYKQKGGDAVANSLYEVVLLLL